MRKYVATVFNINAPRLKVLCQSLPLIAGSIMSKKLASGADALVLDVKTGDGAFLKEEEEAFALAQAMVEIGEGAGVRTAALITGMEEPLGRAVGNALAVNPCPLIVPCHRVIRSDGTIGGFTGGEGMKRRLLVLEVTRFGDDGRLDR